LIDGPTSVNQFEQFFETRHQLTAKHIADLHGLDYYSCNNELDLTNNLPKFLDAQSKKPALLEIFTYGTLSAEVYKKYWSEMTELTLET
jgi:2-succinyl-5-enolpyruvyl-6-hydroxy-3-cyclohexene-1-carboxylate synthase